ncbi:hypothetical protein BDV23DRAFT_178550 [Aspergillus alliaceus]|uniref:Uncharacterized protein n=1 Tax=Petromyces alliaceus TaxID=209559 RepID=A0A5N7CNN1_PETAA|nr:hypothetical protein BDV23DRAFT_178550 [Aspergillus alliaceus]
MSTITPESIPVFYTVGRTTGTTDDLKGLSFPTAYPPDVGPRTRLIAVCGITDDKGKASPKKDIRKRSKLKYAAQYGPDNDAPNIALHGKLIRLLKGRQKFSDEEIDNLYETLRYRLDALAPADELAKVRGVTNEAFNAYSFKLFLSARLAMSGLDYNGIQNRIEYAHSWKHIQAEAISALHGSQIKRDEEVIRGRDMLLDRMASLGRKVHAVFRH